VAAGIAPPRHQAYIMDMRKGSPFTVILFNFALAFCALVLVVAFIAVGAGLVAIFAVFTTLCILTFLTFFPRSPEPVFVRRVQRRRSTRAPPLL